MIDINVNNFHSAVVRACLNCVAIIAAWNAGIPALLAAPIKFTFSATGSGSLGANPFATTFKITSFADTSQVVLDSPGVYRVPNSNSVVEVLGLNPATFTIPTANYSNNTLPGVGFSAPTLNLAILFSSGDPAFATYKLDSSFGPLPGVALFNPGSAFATNQGNFVLNDVNSPATFQAAIIPEPATVLLLIAAIAQINFRRAKMT